MVRGRLPVGRDRQCRCHRALSQGARREDLPIRHLHQPGVGPARHGSGQLSDAEEIYREGIKACPDDALLFFNYGVLLDEQSRGRRSDRQLPQSASQGPKFHGRSLQPSAPLRSNRKASGGVAAYECMPEIGKSMSAARCLTLRRVDTRPQPHARDARRAERSSRPPPDPMPPPPPSSWIAPSGTASWRAGQPTDIAVYEMAPDRTGFSASRKARPETYGGPSRNKGRCWSPSPWPTIAICIGEYSVTLRTDRGPRALRIAGVYYDYRSDRGWVAMSRESAPPSSEPVG